MKTFQIQTKRPKNEMKDTNAADLSTIVMIRLDDKSKIALHAKSLFSFCSPEI